MAQAITPVELVIKGMGKRGLIGMVVVFAIGFILLGVTKCGYDKIEELKEQEAAAAAEAAATGVER